MFVITYWNNRTFLTYATVFTRLSRPNSEGHAHRGRCKNTSKWMSDLANPKKDDDSDAEDVEVDVEVEAPGGRSGQIGQWRSSTKRKVEVFHYGWEEASTRCALQFRRNCQSTPVP